MITVKKENVIRIVTEESLSKWRDLGYTSDWEAPPVYEEEKTEAPVEVSPEASWDEDELKEMTVAELRSLAKEMGITGVTNMNKATLVAMIMNH